MENVVELHFFNDLELFVQVPGVTACNLCKRVGGKTRCFQFQGQPGRMGFLKDHPEAVVALANRIDECNARRQILKYPNSTGAKIASGVEELDVLHKQTTGGENKRENTRHDCS